MSGYSLVGDDEIICVKDNNYLINNQPECVLGKLKDIKLKTSRNLSLN